MKVRISKKLLKKDIDEYSRLNRKKFTAGRYAKISEIEYRANRFLTKFSQDEVQIDDVKLWALYINTFGKNDELLDKLQSRADFDVRAYLEKKNTGALEKVGNFLGMNKQPYFSASVLRKKYNNYKNACQKSYGAPLFRGKYNRLAQKLRTEAQDYVDAYAAGKFMLRPEDYQEFRNYIKIVCHPVGVGSKEQQVLSEVAGLISKQKEAPVVRQNQPQNKKNFLRRISGRVKVWGLAVLTLAGSLWGIKSCENNRHTEQQRTVTEVRKMPVEKKETTTLADTTVWSKVTRNKENKTKENQMSQNQKIWNNYYDNAVEILSSTRQKEKIYKQIDSQLERGIFSLPQDVSKEKLAYTYLVYKEYGVRSSLENALQSKEKLSSSEQAQLLHDIAAAGNKGEGVKKMASLANGGILSSFSRYDQASPSLQQKHRQNLKQIKNLKQLMQAKKQVQHQ